MRSLSEYARSNLRKSIIKTKPPIPIASHNKSESPAGGDVAGLCAVAVVELDARFGGVVGLG